MAWIESIVIRGGYLAGSAIGISDIMATPTLPATVGGLNNSGTNTIQSSEPYYYNSDLEKQINVSSYFTLGHADFSDECFADIAIMDGNTVTGFFSLYASRSGLRVEVMGKVKNASGVVIGTFAPSAGAINIDSRVNPTCYLCFCKTESGGKTFYGLYFNLNQRWTWSGRDYSMACFAGAYINDDDIYDYWGIGGHVQGKGKKKSPEFGPASEGGGGYNDIPSNPHGTFDDSSDIIPVPHLPTKGVTSAGFINVYVIDDNDLQTLGEKLFPHFLPAELLADPSQLSTPEMLAVILKSFFGTMVSPIGSTIELADNLGIIDILMNGKLIDYVLDCHIIPTAISGATVEGLKVGYRQFNDLQLAKATTDYVEIDCGSLSIGEYWANFLDYSCTVKLFLPFVGFVPIDNEYWNGGTIKVIYHFNIIDGSFQAYVVSTSSKSQLQDTVIGQYGGVCCVHMPITGLQYSNVVAGLVNGTAGAVAKAGEGNVAGAVTNAMNMAMLRPGTPSSNGYNASSSFLSERFPYLLIERPASQFSENYNKEIGLPLNVTCLLSTVHGFTVVDNPVLNITCSDAEYQELCSLLKSGVIF